MKNLFKTLSIITVFTVIYSCSTKKNAFLNRTYHGITAKYNTLFNGEQAFEKGLKQIREEHKDNFWKRLQIEPITFDEEVEISLKFNDEENKLSGSPFDRAEEKAVKAIQKHSMEIAGYERNHRIDDAYLLLGKSRYYTQRFIPAIEAFNHIITNYADPDLNYETRVWRAKANVRLGNEKIAIQSMKLLLEILEVNEDVPLYIQEQAHTALAMAYTETDSIQKVVDHLKKATQISIDKEQSARNMFILGQIYSELNKKDSARMVFKKLADTRKAPEKYRIHGNIETIKNIEADSSSAELIKRFRKLARNSDYRKYSDELNYQVGVLEEKRDSLNDAIKYYKKSLRAKNGSDYQKTYTYERLGNIYFKKSDYLLAGSYYDSVIQVVPKEFENEKRIRRIKRKNKGLVSLKKYENIVKNNDSILRVVAMPKEEQIRFFENHIEKIKKEDEERRQLLANSQNFGTSFGSGASKKTSNKEKWYFYNTQSKGFGKAEFQRVWGNRPLEDNWRLSDKTIISTTNQNNEDVSDEVVKSKYELATYLDAIPADTEKINKLKEVRNDALYQLGLIYKEQFKNLELAIKNLERLKEINTNNTLELPINYHLYEVYKNIGDDVKAIILKNDILKEYPNSNFASIIKSPNKKIEIETKEDGIEKKYKELYYLYKQGNYREVVNQINSISETIDKSKLIPKFALLRALSIGKYKSKEEYKKALEFVSLGYSKTEESEKAQEILKILK